MSSAPSILDCATSYKLLQNEPLATTFPCLFCNHEKSVTVKLDKKAGVGQLSCKVCNQQFQCAVNCLPPPSATKDPPANTSLAIDLSAGVDVYSDWVDACDAVAKEHGEEHGRDGFAPSRSSAAVGRTSARAAADEDDDNDDDIIDDEDGLGGYGGEGVVADDDEY